MALVGGSGGTTGGGWVAFWIGAADGPVLRRIPINKRPDHARMAMTPNTSSAIPMLRRALLRTTGTAGYHTKCWAACGCRGSAWASASVLEKATSGSFLSKAEFGAAVSKGRFGASVSKSRSPS